MEEFLLIITSSKFAWVSKLIPIMWIVYWEMFCSVFSQGKAEYVPQGCKSARDKASAPLFTYVNEEKLQSIATYASKYSISAVWLHPKT